MIQVWTDFLFYPCPEYDVPEIMMLVPAITIRFKNEPEWMEMTDSFFSNLNQLIFFSFLLPVLVKMYGEGNKY